MPSNSLRVDEHNMGSKIANTDILTNDLTPKMGCKLRISVTLGGAAVFNLIEKRSGQTKTIGMEQSVPLSAGDGYTWEWGASPNSTYNFQVETTVAVDVLRVEEVYTS